MDLSGYLATQPADPRPLPAFPIHHRPGDDREFVREQLDLLLPGTLRLSPGLDHPYLAPGAIYNSLWTWDAYFIGMAVPDDHLDHVLGSLVNLLERVTPEGRAPSLIEPSGQASYEHMGQPIHAQWALGLVRRLQGRVDWLRPLWGKLVATRDWHRRECGSRHGLFTWTDLSGSGIDNDPAIYGRRGSTVGLVDMNCFHYRELLAMSTLSDLLGEPGAARYRQQATTLRAAINSYMWDDRSQCYRHIDLSTRHRPTHQTVTWEVQLHGGTWGCLFPLWTGVANAGQADRLISEHVLRPDRYLSGYGIRSMSAEEPMYNNEPMADPSNWQGPVWGLSTFLTCYGLARYGYRIDAIRIAGRLIDLMGADLRANGVLHEYYHADTGAPLFNPGFLSWNLLARRILDDLETAADPTELQ